jgi:hypothetical protein
LDLNLTFHLLPKPSDLPSVGIFSRIDSSVGNGVGGGMARLVICCCVLGVGVNVGVGFGVVVGVGVDFGGGFDFDVDVDGGFDVCHFIVDCAGTTTCDMTAGLFERAVVLLANET